eukprot:1928988-Rhodomonas_salina.6
MPICYAYANVYVLRDRHSHTHCCVLAYLYGYACTRMPIACYGRMVSPTRRHIRAYQHATRTYTPICYAYMLRAAFYQHIALCVLRVSPC